jgi:hypothetical protein
MRRVATLAVCLLLGVPNMSPAWGFEAHKYIVARAIPLLPPQIRPFFVQYQATIVEHAIDPDLWRTAGWDEESRNHFVDMDAYGPYPFAALPHLETDAVRLKGREFVNNNGRLAWRTEEIFDKLVEAFAQKGPFWRENIKFFSSVIAHYISDAQVPFHAAANHDGQLTNQWGIHARFETELFERFRSRLTVTPKPLVPVPNARDFAFASLTESFTFVPAILEADRAAVVGRDTYDDAYFAAFAVKAKPILERRVSDSITATASIIAAAWEAAGRPALALAAPRVPRKVRRH